MCTRSVTAQFFVASGGPRAQGWTGKCKSCTVSVWLGWVFISRHRPGQVLADLAPWAKVVQTVGCSTFTHGAKPATRRVADGERMNPQGKGGAYAPMQETTSTRAAQIQVGDSRMVGLCQA